MTRITLLAFFVFSLTIQGVFASEPAATGTYEFYTQNVNTFCKPVASNLWSDWEKNSFIKTEQVEYADITKNIGDDIYKKYLGSIKSDPSQIDSIGRGVGPTFLEKASYVYKETMGTIYACAVMNAKMRIIGTLLTKIPGVQSNLKEKLENQLSVIKKNAESKCRVIQDTSELSVKKAILDNTTYQYCNYRQYLYYLDTASKNSLDAYYKTSKTPSTESPNLLADTDSAAREIAWSASKITAEIAHTREVYPQAMVAFTEFEKTYASHILLEFILQDYVELRSSLKKLLNPIGQVIYKASNAQSPK